MRDAWKRGLRVAGYAIMAVAIAHCGDNSNNDNGGGRTPGQRTPTPVRTNAGPTSTLSVPTATGGGGGVTATPTTAGTPSGNACPSAISVLGDETTARLDSGWTGQAFNSKIISRGEATVQTDCGGKARPCGVCNLTGPIANPDVNQGISNNHRCTNNTSIECTDDSACAKLCVGGSNDGKPCSAVTDCPGDSTTCPNAGTCAFFFGAPLPLAAGGVSTCVINQITGNITGTANIETGESTSTTHLTSNVFTSPVQEEPCPACVGDPTIGDGQRGGSCDGGSRNGLTCDIGGQSPTFVAHGATSFDCPPLAGGKIGSLPIILNNATSTTTLTLSDANPDCKSGGGKCFCDTCASLAAEPCTTNADCSGGAVCGGKRCRGGTNNGNICTATTECPSGACSTPGQPTQTNQCDSGSTCVPDATDALSGHCSDGPFENFCGPTEGFRGCKADSDCPAAGDTCSGGKFRGCYLDNGVIGGSVSAFGKADVPVNGVSHPTLSSLFCIAPTSSSAVNSAAGLPGLGRLTLPATAREIE